MDVVIGVTAVQPLRRNNRIYCADCLCRPDREFEVWIESALSGKQVIKLNITSTQLDPKIDVAYKGLQSSN